MKKSPRPNEVPQLDLGKLIPSEVQAGGSNANPTNKHKSLQSPTSRSTISWGTPQTTPHVLSKTDIQLGGTILRPCTHVEHRPASQRKHYRQVERNPITHADPVERKEPEVVDVSDATNQHIENTSDLKQKIETKKKINTPPPNRKEAKREIVIKNNQVFYKQPVHKEDTVLKENNREKLKEKSKYWYLDEDEQDRPPSPKKQEPTYTVDNVAKMQAEYTAQPYSDLHGARKFAAEDDMLKKQQQEIMEQVLADQLSRHVISDAEQDRDPARRNPADPASAFNTAPLRFKSRRLHDTKVSTAGAATESKLKDRITFGARIVTTRDGRDALRELFGFFFHSDSTLTVYEFRLFGKNNNKALPLIERGKYCHVNGRRKGKAYASGDFALGRNLTFLTRNQPRLPDSVKSNDVVTMRVCETSAASRCDDDDTMTSHRDDGSDSALERKDRAVTANVQKLVRESLRGRSVSVVLGLSKLFRDMDRSGDGRLNRSELQQALTTFDIRLPDEELDAVWRVVDENNDGNIDYGEFVRAFIGEMNEARKLLVRKVFRKLDPHKTGNASLLDLRKLYTAKKHPLVTSDALTRAEMEDRFVRTLVDTIGGADRTQVSYVEFAEYYEGLSLAIARDHDFVNMMRNCWGV